MTIRFAAATNANRAARALPACKPVARAMGARAMERAGNDNGPGGAARSMNDQILQAALRHFAQHGLGAASLAGDRARAALVAKDRPSFDWWLGITRTLDRRMAAQVERLASQLA